MGAVYFFPESVFTSPFSLPWISAALHCVLLNPRVMRQPFHLPLSPVSTLAGSHTFSSQMLHRTRKPRSTCPRFLPLHSACCWGRGSVGVPTFNFWWQPYNSNRCGSGTPKTTHVQWFTRGTSGAQPIVVFVAELGYIDAFRIHSRSCGEDTGRVWGNPLWAPGMQAHTAVKSSNTQVTMSVPKEAQYSLSQGFHWGLVT